MKKEEEKSVSYDNGVVCGLIRRGMYKSNFASRRILESIVLWFLKSVNRMGILKGGDWNSNILDQGPTCYIFIRLGTPTES